MCHLGQKSGALFKLLHAQLQNRGQFPVQEKKNHLPVINIVQFLYNIRANIHV